MGDRSDWERTRRLGEKDEPGDDVGELFADDETELDANERRLMAAVEAKLFRTDPPVDVKLDRYVLEGRLGSGGMGVVFKARDPALGRPVAIKFLNADGGATGDRSAGQRRLLREARLIARVSHPNVISIHDVRPYDSLPVEVAQAAGVRGVSARGVFLVMELVDGESLREWQSRPEIAQDRVLQAYLDAGRGLVAVHEAGLVHRDFKPSNVLVGHDGRVRVLDFGLARSSSAPPPLATPDPGDDSLQLEPPAGEVTVTEAGHVVGTPRYMAPEQFSGEALSPRSDVFAFSVSLFEALSGQFPYRDASPSDLLAAKRAGNVRELGPDSTVPAWCVAILRRGLAPKPADRFAGLAEMIDALERQRRGTPKRSGWVVPVALGGVLAAGIAVVTFAGDRDTPPTTAAAAPEPEATPLGDPGLVAVLPFEIATDDTRLGTARDTLPFILAEGMGVHGKLRVVDYFAVRREIEPKGSGPADEVAWREASIRAGAGVLVRGRLEADGDNLRLRLDLDSADGTALGSIERTTTLAELPATLRTLASEAASQVLRDPVAPPASRAYAWDYDTLLADGARFLEHADFALAITRLDAAAAIVPDAPDAWFYLALALSWSEAPDERVSAAIDHALQAGIDGARREFLLGFRSYLERDYASAAQTFRAALEHYAGDPYLTYGLFEALYHSGHPREAMEVVHGLGGEAPAIHQGLMHVLDYQAAQGNPADFERALGLADTIGVAFAEGWQMHARVFAGDYAGALEFLAALDPERHPAGQVLMGRMEVLALSGEVDLALALAEPIAREGQPNVIPALALQTARGAEQERRRYLAIGLAEAEGTTHELQHARELSDLVAVSLPAADDDELRRLADALSSFDPRATLATQLARVVLAGALHERDVLEEGERSPYPEVAALARAALADADGKHDDATNAVREAIASALDGRFITIERWWLARMQHAAGDLEAAATTCEQVIQPPRFHWSWGAAVGPCLAWTLESPDDAPRARAARELQRRLQP